MTEYLGKGIYKQNHILMVLQPGKLNMAGHQYLMGTFPLCGNAAEEH